MSSNKKYWKGLEELQNPSEFEAKKHNEFSEELPLGMGEDLLETKPARRDFLKMMGFSLGAATLAASCEMPVRKIIPYVIKPEEITPGVATYYASTFAEGGNYCSVLVKTREGRPIKIEGNDLSSVTKGGTSAIVQASVLSLYDVSRLKKPLIEGKESSWREVDKAVKAELAGIRGDLVIFSSSILSPSTKQVIADFVAKYPNARHVTYDVLSVSGILEANRSSFGKTVIPSYNFDKAEVIVSFDADFLGTWISPVEYAKDYSVNRRVTAENPNMSRHFQFEGRLSMTGANADERYLIKPSEEGALLTMLYGKIAGTSVAGLGIENNEKAVAGINKVAAALQKARGKSLVVSGSNDPNIQILVNAINHQLGNYGKTIDIERHANYKQGIDSEVKAVLDGLKNGRVEGIILYNTNPVYDHPMGDQFAEGIKKAKLSISFAQRLDESAALTKYVCPDNFYLEAWNDAEPVKGKYSLAQPAITKLFDTRQAQESLLAWAGADKAVDFYDYIKGYWKKVLYPTQNKYSGFQEFWDKSLQNGVYEIEEGASLMKAAEESKAKSEEMDNAPAGTFKADVRMAVSRLPKPGSRIELILYPKTTIGDGRFANNPWLQETPDPVSKATWGNYISVSSKFAETRDLKQNQVVKLTIKDKEIELPVLIQPGQNDETIAIALGYGRKKTREDQRGLYQIGENAYPLAQYNGTIQYSGIEVENPVKTGADDPIAQTQTQHHINPEQRPIVRNATLGHFKEDPYTGYTIRDDEGKIIRTGKEERAKLNTIIPEVTLYPKLNFPGHHWGMSIDLNTCIGCNACVVGCIAENNLPVVGKKEVLRGRDMHWIRIDRYYITEGQKSSNPIKDLANSHEPDDNPNPEVVFMPMLCQHCDNAPCENVCPVGATNHSSEGLNQMAYNRCVGTRYCENNCPYKVRRFNWFDYTSQDSFAWNEVIVDGMANEKGSEFDPLVKMVLNPDVTVRSRGVIEKCTFCVQRIQEGKLNAKKEGRPLKDGEIKTACQSACPTNAIVFGDLNDKESQVSKLQKAERNYFVLEEIHTLPSVGYLTKINNKDIEVQDLA